MHSLPPGQVVDRAVLCAVLEGLGQLQLPSGVRARAPRHLVVASLSAVELQQQLTAAGGRLAQQPLGMCRLLLDRPSRCAMRPLPADAKL